jgi:hypothetical protein
MAWMQAKKDLAPEPQEEGCSHGQISGAAMARFLALAARHSSRYCQLRQPQESDDPK